MPHHPTSPSWNHNLLWEALLTVTKCELVTQSFISKVHIFSVIMPLYTKLFKSLSFPLSNRLWSAQGRGQYLTHLCKHILPTCNAYCLRNLYLLIKWANNWSCYLLQLVSNKLLWLSPYQITSSLNTWFNLTLNKSINDVLITLFHRWGNWDSEVQEISSRSCIKVLQVCTWRQSSKQIDSLQIFFNL